MYWWAQDVEKTGVGKQSGFDEEDRVMHYGCQDEMQALPWLPVVYAIRKRETRTPGGAGAGPPLA